MTEPASHESAEKTEHECYAHVVPVWLLVGVFAALILLTGLTVLLHEPWWSQRLGAWSLAAAMLIATAKGTLVALYFMHLRWDRPFHAIVFVSALVFVGLFLALTVLDTVEYWPDIEQYDQLRR